VINAPAAAVIIPTHDRVELLQKVLDSVLAQTIPAEIYVMDDACQDGTEAMIRSKYPQVFFHREVQAKGPTFQRNKAAALTRAPILVTIDDDCILPSNKTLEQTLEAFDHPRVAGVTLPFVNILADSIIRTGAKKDGRVQATLDYYGGMAALRRDAYLGVGGYRAYYFIQIEEPDLCIRFMQAGCIMRLGWADPVHHLESPLRDAPGRDRQGPRNLMLYLHYNVPWPQYPFRVVVTSVACMIHGFRKRHPIRVLRGLCQGYAGILHQLHQRAPVSQKIYRLSRLLRRRGSMPLDEFESRLPSVRPFPKD
jgi:glycosyltransferase involved in cell wall biosynthesis